MYKFPLFGGYFISQYQFVRGKDAGRSGSNHFNRHVGALGYHYFLSKQTMAYAVVSEAKGFGLLQGEKGSNRIVTHVGMVHFF